MSVFLGIDTSNYTTSLALVDLNGRILAESKQLLKVKESTLGLRQSDAFYQHVMTLPMLFESFSDELISQISAIGVSTQPRPVEGSYMPVFNSGHQFGKVISKSLAVPLYEYSHQEGHILASLNDKPEWLHKKTLSLHASGGTTEFLISKYNTSTFRFDIEIIGCSKDISFGQLIDRLGVKLGFGFPCGKAMEEALLTSGYIIPENYEMKRNLFLPKYKEPYFNLSGFENKANQLLQLGHSPEEVILELFEAIACLIGMTLIDLLKIHGEMPTVLAGGVCSNNWIKSIVHALLSTEGHHELHSGKPQLCTDNAVGIAHMTALQHTAIK